MALIETEEQLRAEIAESEFKDVAIDLGKVRMTDSIRGPVSTHWLTIKSIGGYLDMRPIQFRGWEHGPRNGLVTRTERVALVGVRFNGFHDRGAALKLQSGVDASIVGCRFVNIGTRKYPYRVDTPQSSGDVVSCNCIGGSVEGRLLIDSNDFSRCATSNMRWTHCCYAHGLKRTEIRGNQFYGCGNPFAVNGEFSRLSLLLDNHIETNVTGPEVADEKNEPYVVVVPSESPMVHSGNTYVGGFRYPFRMPNLWNEEFYSDDNDYSRMKVDDAFGLRYGWGESPYSAWINNQDQHSKGPIT